MCMGGGVGVCMEGSEGMLYGGWGSIVLASVMLCGGMLYGGWGLASVVLCGGEREYSTSLHSV